MRIKNRETIPPRQVLGNEIGQERRFSGAGLSDDMHVGAAIAFGNAKHPILLAEVRMRKKGQRIVGRRAHPSMFRESATGSETAVLSSRDTWCEKKKEGAEDEGGQEEADDHNVESNRFHVLPGVR